MNATPDLAAIKRYLLEPEREDARRRLADPGYWGETGAWVERAVWAIEAVLDRVPATPTVADWLSAITAGLEHARADFRRNESDPDGYGSATFSTCLTRCHTLHAACCEEDCP